jgi:hypothetical protein
MGPAVDALEVPNQVNPGVRRKWLAVLFGWNPFFVERVPNVLLARAIEVAFGALGPASTAEGLVDVEFERLRRVEIVHVEIE